MAENFVITRIALGAGFVLALLGAIVLARLGSRGRTIAAVVAALSGILVLALTLSPDVRAVQGQAVCNLTPYAFPFDLLNVALFLLPAMFAVVAVRRPVPVVLAVPVVSALIELVQFLSPALGRRCDVDDWLANLLGGVLGVLLGVLALRAARRRRA
jgi:glycopeptide antibiotics resistance protein